MPCSWTGCSESPECFADGAGLLDCPSMDSICQVGCSQLCGKSDLTALGKTCGDLSVDEAHCKRSFFTKKGKRMPCKWSPCKCYADGETLLKCDNLGDICPPSLLMEA